MQVEYFMALYQVEKLMPQLKRGVKLGIPALLLCLRSMMEFANFFLKQQSRPKTAMETFVLLLSPFAPHIAEELWEALGHADTLAYESWPVFDESLIKEDTIEVPVQIMDKLRGRIQVPADGDKDALETAAKADFRIAELLEGKTIIKTIVVPGRMVNFVVK